jgi:hypothetical protein
MQHLLQNVNQLAGGDTEKLSRDLLRPIISTSSEVEYESEMSFFEEEPQFTDSEDHDDAMDFSVSSARGKGRKGAARVLIKHKKSTISE